MWYNGKVFLSVNKDPSTDLWTLPIDLDIDQATKSIVKPTKVSSSSQEVFPPPKKNITMPLDAHGRVSQVASFKNSVKTRANGVRFAHQSLCNPKISTLLKAV